MLRNVSSRPYQPGDEVTIVELYNRITGRSRTIEQHAWEWLAGPEGAGCSWVIELEESGEKRIIGHQGLIPVPMTVFGRKVLAGKSENGMVDPRYRGKNIFPSTAEHGWLKQAKEKFGLLFTTYGIPPNVRMWRRLGFLRVSGYELFVKPKGNDGLDRASNKLLRRIGLSGIGSAWPNAVFPLSRRLLRSYFREPSVAGRTVDLSDRVPFDEIAKELDGFCQRNNPLLGISVNRSSAYLKWRIVDNPHLSYGFFVARRGTVLVGYVIVEYRTKLDVEIVDIVVENRDEGLFDEILSIAENILADRGFNTFQYLGLAGRSWLNGSFLRCGYRPVGRLRRQLALRRTEETYFLVRSYLDVDNALAITSADNWYFTALFREGI